MKTKVMAAKTATGAGCDMTITEGSRMNPLTSLIEGAAATLFTARTTPKAARKHWIASMKPQGVLVLDDGAVQALRSASRCWRRGLRM